MLEGRLGGHAYFACGEKSMAPQKQESAWPPRIFERAAGGYLLFASSRSISDSAAPIDSFRTRSAVRSKGVGSRLMITSFAPCCFAVRGMLAAGSTTKDEPAPA